MPTLKGQNFRVYLGKSVVAKSTNCTITLTGNTEDASTKDDIGMASKPEVVSKSWNVSVESLDVTDTAAMLNAIKNLTPFTIAWDETSTTDNQTVLGALFARTGTAYLNDITYSFNDRENSTKQIQFTGSGPLETRTTSETEDILVDDVFTKGQFVRMFLSSDNSTAPSKVIAAAKSLSLHVSMQLENVTTKDTTGDWQIMEPTALSYDISTNALMRSGDTITSSVQAQTLAEIESIYENSLPVKFQIANVSGDNQRTKGSVLVSGYVVITQLTLNGPNRQNATYDASFNGYGIYTVGS